MATNNDSFVNKLILGLLTAAIMFLASFVLRADTEIALLKQENSSQKQMIDKTQESVDEALKLMRSLDKSLSILNDRLIRELHIQDPTDKKNIPSNTDT